MWANLKIWKGAAMGGPWGFNITWNGGELVVNPPEKSDVYEMNCLRKFPWQERAPLYQRCLVRCAVPWMPKAHRWIGSPLEIRVLLLCSSQPSALNEAWKHVLVSCPKKAWIAHLISLRLITAWVWSWYRLSQLRKPERDEHIYIDTHT